MATANFTTKPPMLFDEVPKAVWVYIRLSHRATCGKPSATHQTFSRIRVGGSVQRSGFETDRARTALYESSRGQARRWSLESFDRSEVKSCKMSGLLVRPVRQRVALHRLVAGGLLMVHTLES